MSEEKKKDDVLDGQEAQDQSGAGATGNGDGNGAAGAQEQSKTFTQEQVTRMMAKEKHQGANSVYNELGIDPKDTKALDAVKAFIASQKTDEQKAAERSSAQAAELAAAQHKAAIAEAKAEAMLIGVQAQFVDDAVTLALARVESEEGAELKTVLGELKVKYPVWFGQAAGQSDEDEQDGKGKDKKKDTESGKDATKKTVGQKGTGSSVKTSKEDKGGEGEKNLGARLAAKRKTAGTAKKSYWS